MIELAYHEFSALVKSIAAGLTENDSPKIKDKGKTNMSIGYAINRVNN